jgi:TonB family protein
MRQILVFVISLLLVSSATWAGDRKAEQPYIDGFVDAEGHIVAADVPSSSRATIAFGKVIAKPQPGYPIKARAAGIAGSIIIIAHVTDAGRVDGAEVRWPGPVELEQAALQAANGWRFTATRADDRAVAAYAQITFRFY